MLFTCYYYQDEDCFCPFFCKWMAGRSLLKLNNPSFFLLSFDLKNLINHIKASGIRLSRRHREPPRWLLDQAPFTHHRSDREAWRLCLHPSPGKNSERALCGFWLLKLKFLMRSRFHKTKKERCSVLEKRVTCKRTRTALSNPLAHIFNHL